MKGYWLKIAFGAVGIFLIGMVIVAAGRHGVEHVKETIALQTLSFQGNGAPLRVQGREVGQISKVQVKPLSEGGIPHVSLTVGLNPGFSPAEFTDCVLVAGEDFDPADNEGLTCLDSSAANDDSLVDVGEVRLQPGGELIRLVALRSALEKQHWYRSLRAPAPAARHARGASFQLDADSSKAFMMIRDEHGNPVFQLNADSEGAFLQVRDSTGKEIVRFRADSTGVQGNLNSD
jgi:hypothetical protein